jgi:hypothetical protein
MGGFWATKVGNTKVAQISGKIALAPKPHRIELEAARHKSIFCQIKQPSRKSQF